MGDNPLKPCVKESAARERRVTERHARESAAREWSVRERRVTERQAGETAGGQRGSGTVLAAGLGLVVVLVMAMMLLLVQSAVMASRAASAADLAALAAADALRGISAGEPCAVAAEVAGRHAASVVSCTEGTGQTIEIRTELRQRTMLGNAKGHARAGPPP